MRKLSSFGILFHLLGWCLFLLAPVIFSPGPLFHRVSDTEMISLAVRSVTLMVYFYANLFYITPVVLKRRGPAFFAVITISLIIGISYVNSRFHHFYVERHRLGPRPTIPDDFGPPDGAPFGRPGVPFGPPPDGGPPIMFASPTFSSILITSLVAIISSMLVFRQELDKVHEEKQEQALQRIAAELTALKLQISPHFLFNTLNNIRWLVRSKSEYAEEAIVKLSHLLRYILYQTDQEKVDLSKELDHLRDFIELQKMRIENQALVEFEMTGDVSQKQIVPLLLLPLTENFFKHADFSGSFVNKIGLEVNGESLIFKTENKVSRSEGDEHGIGLKNVVKRLNLHYPNRHLLRYFEKEEVFYLQLELILNGN